MNVILMPFLYFPEDKSEYIPAAISFFIFMILMIITFTWIIRNSRKQAKETEELERKILQERRAERETKDQHSVK